MLQSSIDVLYKPELTANLNLQYTGNVTNEFTMLPLWHTFLPDQFAVKGKNYNISDILFTNNNIVFQEGLDSVIQAMSTTSAGEVLATIKLIHINNISSFF